MIQPPGNNVLLVKIEGPGAGIPSIIIYLLLKGFLQTPLLINQPMGKGHLCHQWPGWFLLGLKVGFGGWIMFGTRQCSALLGGKICVTDNRDDKYNPMSIIENSDTCMWNHQPIRCLFPSLPANAWQEPKQWETTEHSNGYGTKTEVGQFRPSNSKPNKHPHFWSFEHIFLFRFFWGGPGGGQ